MKDNIQSLYNALIKNGYSAEDIGSADEFRTDMQDAGLRDALYNYVVARGDFNIGSKEAYDRRIGGVSAPSAEHPKAADNLFDVLAANKPQYNQLQEESIRREVSPAAPAEPKEIKATEQQKEEFAERGAQSVTYQGGKRGVITVDAPVMGGLSANRVLDNTNAMLSANDKLFKPQTKEQQKSAFLRGTTGTSLGFGNTYTSYKGNEYSSKAAADMASVMERKQERETDNEVTEAQAAAEEEALTGLWEGLAQGTEQGIAGLQYLEGEYAAQVGGTQKEPLSLLQKIVQAEKAGVPEEKILGELRRAYAATADMVETNGRKSGNMSTLLQLGTILGVLPEGSKVVRDYDRFKAMGVDTADLLSIKKYLTKEAGIQKYADVQMAKAAETMAQAKPTEGWAWFGSLVPQMVPTAIGIAATAATKSPQVAKMTARIGMAALSGSAAGQTMYEARQAGASDGEVWAAGGAAFLTEYLTEKLPMDRYLGRLVGKVSGDVVLNPAVAKTVREAVQRIKTKSGAALTFSNEGAMAELNKLVKKANKALGGKLLAKKNIDDFLTDILAEGGSEFAAEFTQTFIPMIYEDPENYPNLVQALANGIEGAKAGVVMGGMLGGASKALEHRQQRSRRKQQGYDGTTDVAEVLGSTDEGKVVVLRDGATETIEREQLGEVIRYGFDEFDSGHIIYNIEESRMVGESIKDAAARADANNMLSIQEEKVRTMLGLEADADVSEAVGDPVAMVRQMMAEGKSDAEVQTILDYANAAAVVDGMVQRVRDDIDSRVAESDAAIDMTANTNGRVVAATTNKGEKVYVVVGNVVNNEHGNIDTANSDQSIVVYNQATGKREMMDSKNLAAVDSDTDVAELKATAADAIREEMATAAAGEIDGVLPMNAGDTYMLLDENGMEHQAQIVGPAEDGSIVVNIDGQQAAMTAEDIQAQNKAYNMQRARDFDAAAHQAANAENVYNAMDEVMVRNDEGNVVAATITDYNADEDAYTLQLSEGTIDGAAAPKMGRAKMDARVESVNGEYIGEAVVPTDAAPVAAIPTDEQGNKVYESAEPAAAWADILADSDGDVEIAQSAVESMLEDKRKALAEIENTKPENGVSMAEKIAAQKAHKAAVEKAKADVAFWENVAQQKDAVATEEVAEQSEEKRLYDTVGGSPVALSYLLEGGEGSIINAGYFLHGVAAAFPAVTNEIEDARHAMGAGALGMAPLDFVEQCPNEVDAVRQIIERTYGAAGVAVYEKLLANASGFYPRDGAVVEAEIESLRPVVDKQGNPIGRDGNLSVESVQSIEDITDADFENPTRNIQLPQLPNNVSNAIGSNGRPVVIKKNVFEKNRNSHTELTAEDSRNILQSALYNPNLVGSTQPITRPDYKVAIQTGDKNSIVVLDVYQGKNHVEIVGWRRINEKGLQQMQRQAAREGGQFLILSPNNGSAADLSALPGGLSSTDKDRAEVSNVQEKAQENSTQHFVDRIAEEWSARIGVPVQVVESVDEVVNDQAREAIENGVAVEGWYEPSTGRVCIYKPNFSTEQRVSEVIIHEAVAHKGLVGLLGQKAFDSLCDQVWAMMPQSVRDEYENYPGVENIEDEVARHRAAADEYIAHLAEQTDLTDAEKTIWDKVIAALRTLLESAGINLKMSDADLGNLIKASYAKMAKEAREGMTQETTAQNANGKAKMSVAEQQATEDAIAAMENSELGQALMPTEEAIEVANEVNDEVRFAIAIAEDIEKKSTDYHRAYHEQGKEGRLGIADGSQPIPADILGRANEAIRNMVAEVAPHLNEELFGARVLPEEVYGKGTSTIFSNGSYGRTMENLLICLRTLSYNEFTDDVKERLGRPITTMESFLASQMLYDIAVDPQCLYCYVSLDRKAYDEFLLRYLEQRDSVVEKFNKLEDKSDTTALYEEYLAGRKDTKEMRARFNQWISIAKNGGRLMTAEDLTTASKRRALIQEDRELAKQIKDAEKYAQSASWAKKMEDYRAYTGELLRMPIGTINMLNSEYGLRFYSFSEFNPAFIVENMQMVRDAALRGLKGLAYTKEIDFVKIFAPTGININVSVFGRRDSNGEMQPDIRQGADWNAAKELREEYDNVGVVFVATNDRDVEWALEQDFVDVVIPFHIVRTGTEISNFYGWENYSSQQSDKDAGGRKKDVMPTEHHNNKETYLSIIEERGLTPRFEKWKDHPNYMKLVNETRQSVDNTTQIQPVFNLDAAKESWGRFYEKGGYFGGWYNVDQAGYEEAVEQVVEDIKAGKTAKDVEYGRQDMPINEAAVFNPKLRRGGHGNTPRFSVAETEAKLAVAEEKVANAKGVAELADAIAEREAVRFAAKRYGGNSGYVGYSKSKRAVDAEERGLKNASQMNAEFAKEVNSIIEERTGEPSKLSLKAIKAALPNIPADEWHHTSMYGNKTNYYSAERVASHFAKDPELEAKDKAELEAAKRYDSYAAAVRSRIPMMKIETALGEEDAFITSEGYAVEVPKNVVNNPEGARLFAIGELTGEEPYVVDKFSDWAYKNREQFKAAVQEYVDAVQKAKEEVEQSGVKFSVKPLVGNKKLHEGLRELEEGETSFVERVFTENKNFEFSSKNTIKSYNDVAYIFKELENESIENAFAVLVKGGRPTVVHLGMGSFTQTMVSGAALNVAVRRIQPEKIYFVHNHPSGTLKSSIQDNNVLRDWKAAFGEDIVQEGIIIDSFSGKYGIFGGVGNLEYDMPSEQGDERPIKVYSFSKQIYQKDFKPSEQLTSSEDVAAFITSQRLGDRPKLGLLIANNQLQITGNVFLPYSEVTNKNADAIANDIAYYTTVLGGNRAFLFGNVSIKDVEGKNISNGVNTYSQGEIKLLDFIEIDGGRYKSANDEGVRFSAKRKASKTALPEDESSFKGAVISDADRAKVLKNLDTLQDIYQNKSIKSTKAQDFIGDLSEALNLRNNGNNSNYGDYVAVNGKEVTIRISDHNVSVKDMDGAGKVNGISIVVSRKPNEGVRDSGDSHIVEFFYNDKKLRTSVGNPFIEIINSFKQTVYSGEYKDATGIAEREEVNGILEENSAEQEDLTNITDEQVSFKRVTDPKQQRLAAAEEKVANAKGVAELADAIAEREQIKNETVRFSRGGAPRSSLREEYDRRTRRPTRDNDVSWYSNVGNRLVEAYQDSMHSLKVLQDLVAEETGTPIESFENAYWAENRMSSMNKTQQEAYERDFMKPMHDALMRLQKEGASYQEIIDYLFAKHGLERNQVFAQREGKVRDYSGLSALTGSSSHYTDIAQQMVDDFEAKYEADELWEKINAATKQSLKTEYDAGLMSKDTYDYVSTMFEYYIPLRGWSENAASNEYDYIGSGKPRMTSKPKKATGRRSLADDPIATIGHMGGNSIIRANRNKMKQHFLNFALNHETDLLTVTKQWYVFNPISKKWERNTPDIPIDATGDEVADIIRQHEADMKALGAQAKLKKGKEMTGMHITTGELKEHEVRIFQGGTEYVVYINGNPRAAQALNGTLNPDSGNPSIFKRAARNLKNFMSQAFTSWNPAFVIDNFRRDQAWSLAAVATKENVQYLAQFELNNAEVFVTAQMPRLLHAWKKGELDLNDPIQRYFNEFMMNGGETGFTQLHTVNQYKKDIQRMVRKSKGGVLNAMDSMNIFRKSAEGFELWNRMAEDHTRFVTYMTSRQMGRDVARSVWDAKEITVNFNKKGSGEMGAKYMNFAYVFFNASIQGMANFGKVIKNNPKKATLMLGSFFAMGALLPMLNELMLEMMGDDEDKQAYADLPEWVRENNLVFYIPFTKRGFITWPLPHELRPAYKIGMNAYAYFKGEKTGEEALWDVAKGAADMLPLKFDGNDGNLLVNLAPTGLQPFMQVQANVNYFGQNVYREPMFGKKGTPAHMLAYKGTAPLLVKTSAWLNEATGGNDVDKGTISINPDIAEHLLESYLGGTYKFYSQVLKTALMPFNEDLQEVRNVPIVNKFYVSSGDERNYNRSSTEVYYAAVEEAENTQRRLNEYSYRHGIDKYADLLFELQGSPEMQRMGVANTYKYAISEINRAININKAQENKQKVDTLEAQKRVLIQQAAERLRELEE